MQGILTSAKANPKRIQYSVMVNGDGELWASMESKEDVEKCAPVYIPLPVTSFLSETITLATMRTYLKVLPLPVQRQTASNRSGCAKHL